MHKHSGVSFLVILCAVLMAVLIFSQFIPRCSGPWNPGFVPPPDTIIVTDTFYVYDTIPIEVKVPVPVPYYVEKPQVIPAETNKDSCCTVLFAKAYYRDTLMNDTVALIVLEDTMSQNRIGQRSLTYINRKPIQVINTTTTIITHTPAGVFANVGVVVPFAEDEKTGFSAGATLIRPQKNKTTKTRFSAVSGSWDFVNKRLSVSYGLKF